MSCRRNFEPTPLPLTADLGVVLHHVFNRRPLQLHGNICGARVRSALHQRGNDGVDSFSAPLLAEDNMLHYEAVWDSWDSLVFLRVLQARCRSVQSNALTLALS